MVLKYSMLIPTRIEELREQLEKHLAILRWQGVITDWHDRKISPGGEWQGDINEHLNTAHIILLLISSDFVASPYCYDIEMRQAMERHKARRSLCDSCYTTSC